MAALDNKNPSIRAETAGFLARAFAKCVPSALPKGVLKPLCSSLIKVGVSICLKVVYHIPSKGHNNLIESILNCF